MDSLYNKIGLTTQSQTGATLLGIDANGNPIYGTPALSNDATPGVAPKLVASYQQDLRQIEGGTKEEYDNLEKLKTIVEDPNVIQELDTHRANNNKQEFSKSVAKAAGGDTKTAHAAYDAWGVMNPNQKAVSLIHVNGATDKINRKEYLPGVDTKTALRMQKEGIPMQTVKANWQQIDAIHQAIGHEGDTVSAIKRSARSGQLGPAQNMTESDKKFYKLTSAPHYGVGAMENPKGTQVPRGYTVAGEDQGKQIIVPQGNEASVSVNPKYNSLAGAIYSKWPEAGKVPASGGSRGGSNMYKTLTTLYDTNPKALGGALDRQIPGDASLSEKANGFSVKTLTTGTPNGAKAMTTENAVKEYGRSGIQNKEIGYKLANQAYAEGRINDSQLFTIHRSLDDAFDGDKTLTKISPTESERKASTVRTQEKLAETQRRQNSDDPNDTGNYSPNSPDSQGAEGTAEKPKEPQKPGTIGASMRPTQSGVQESQAIAKTGGQLALAYFFPGSLIANMYLDKQWKGSISKVQSWREKNPYLSAMVFGDYGAIGDQINAKVFGSSKSSQQQIRDRYRGAVLASGSNLFDEKYQGTLADGSTYDFGKDGKKHGKLDTSKEFWEKAAALGNVLAASTGVTGKAGEAVATMYANAALSNAESEEDVINNMKHFAQSLGLNATEVQTMLDAMHKDGTITEEQYKVWSGDMHTIIGG